jgi:hypothetical protein
MPVRSRVAAIAVTVLLALTAACSGEGDGGSDEAARTPTETANDAASETESPAQPTALPTGELATVMLTAGRRSGDADVTVTQVRRGRIADLRDFVLDARTRTSTPYYALVRVRNTGDANLSGAAVPLWGLDSTGTVLPPARVRGVFTRCQTRALPNGFTAGKQTRTCLLFLVPKGARLTAVQYRFDDETTAPISWPVR